MPPHWICIAIKMPRFVKTLCLTVQVYKSVSIPDHIKLDVMGEGDTWWIKWDRLYYENGDKVIDLPDYNHTEWEGDYKRPGTEVEECESVDEPEAECESECECSAHRAYKTEMEEVVPDESVSEAQAEEYQNRIREMEKGK